MEVTVKGIGICPLSGGKAGGFKEELEIATMCLNVPEGTQRVDICIVRQIFPRVGIVVESQVRDNG